MTTVLGQIPLSGPLAVDAAVPDEAEDEPEEEQAVLKAPIRASGRASLRRGMGITGLFTLVRGFEEQESAGIAAADDVVLEEIKAPEQDQADEGGHEQRGQELLGLQV